MEYNSQKEILTIPEYGRHIQNMISYAKTIENDEYRQHFVEKIVDLMYQMNPQNKNLNEYKEKLWNHVFRIADFDLKVVPPMGKAPTAEESNAKPDIMGYPPNETKFRHYGHFVKKLIKKAIEMEDEEKKKEFILIIATYMKMAYTTWNREHYVSDELVKGDLSTLSDGALTLPENADLSIPQSYINKKRRRPTNYKSKGGGRDNNRGKGQKHKKRK